MDAEADTDMSDSYDEEMSDCSEEESAATIANRTESPLLILPAEIRNNIWHFCVVNDAYQTYLDQHLQVPALLHACSQTRDEGLAMFHLENAFLVDVFNCNTDVLQAYFHKCVHPLDEEEEDLSKQVYLLLRPYQVDTGCWPNLITWCNAVWRDAMPSPKFRMGLIGMSASDEHMIRAAVKIAKKSRRLSWETVLEMLEGVRKIAGASNGLASQLTLRGSRDEVRAQIG